MVSPLTIQQVKVVVDAAGVGPYAARDRALVCLAAATGMDLAHVVQVESFDFIRCMHCQHYPVGELFSAGWFEGKPRLVALDQFTRGIIENAFQPPLNDDEDDLLNYLPYLMFATPDGLNPMSVLRAKRIVARAFVAAGQPPQRAAARLLEAFHRLATTTYPTRREAQDEPRSSKRSSGPRTAGTGVAHA